MPESPYSFDNFVKFLNLNFGIIMVVLLAFVLGFGAGSLWTENRMLKAGGFGAPTAAPTANAGAGAAAPAEPTEPQGPTPEQLAALPEVTDADHIRGSQNAKVTLVEYSDFECPFCARFHPTVQAMLDEFGDDVAWVYRHYPLNFHPMARPSALASECIADRYGNDAFWTFADEMVELTAGPGLTESAMYNVVEELGYNRADIESCVENDEFGSIVDEQFATGGAAGVSGTPGTFIVTEDGAQELIPGALPEDSVKTLIEKYL